MITNREQYENVKIRNGTWFSDISQSVISADISMTTGQVSELTISVDDPGFEYIRKYKLPLKTRVDYDSLRFSIAALEMNEGGGEGGFTMTCRPHAVRLLKDLKGKKSMSSVSPSTWVLNECKQLGIKAVVQPSAKRSSVSRDITEAGQQGNEEANAWTTFSRLANEIGFLCFEMEGVVYFGQPTWFIQSRPKARAHFGSGDTGFEVTSIPTCDISLDNDSRKTIAFSVPVEREKSFRPGNSVHFTGVPGFDGTYFISSVDFPLAGPGEVSVSASTAYNPEPTLEPNKT